MIRHFRGACKKTSDGHRYGISPGTTPDEREEMSDKKMKEANTAAIGLLMAALKSIAGETDDVGLAEAPTLRDVSKAIMNKIGCEYDDAQRLAQAGVDEMALRYAPLANDDGLRLALLSMMNVDPVVQPVELRNYANEADKLPPNAYTGHLELLRGDADKVVVDYTVDPDAAPIKPLDPSIFRKKLAKAGDEIIKNASGGQLTSIVELIERTARAERQLYEIHVSRRGAEAAAAGDPDQLRALDDAPLWTSSKVKLSDVITEDLIGGTGVAKHALMNSDVSIWSCGPKPHKDVPAIDPHYIFDVNALAKALYCIERGRNLAFVGPTGCGKTTILEQISARLQRPFYRISVDGEMRRREIIGGFKQVTDANGSRTQWFDGLLVKGITQPSIIDLDEIDRGDPDFLYAAHQALERNGVTLLDDGGRYIPMHPHCAITATANTKGRADANGLYASVNEMSAATHDRIAFWHECDYQSVEDEARMLVRKVLQLDEQTAKAIATVADRIRVAFKAGDVRTSCSSRLTISAGEYAVFLINNNFSNNPVKDAMVAVFQERAVDESDAATIKEFIGMGHAA